VPPIPAPLLRVAQDGLDFNQIAATVVVVLARLRPRTGGPEAQRRVAVAPHFLPPRSWQAPSLTLQH
jgi:hypothetical protein